MRRTAERGFTLIEMVIVLTIITILAAVMTPVFRGYVDRARINVARNDVKQIASALLQFNTDTKMWPIYRSVNVAPIGTTSNVFSVLEGPGTDPEVAATVTDWSALLSDASGTTSLEGMLNTNYFGLGTEGLFGWNGPYVELGTDPWGGRYLVTASTLNRRSPYAAYIISAGPNQVIETAFYQYRKHYLTVGGDDIVQRIQ